MSCGDPEISLWRLIVYGLAAWGFAWVVFCVYMAWLMVTERPGCNRLQVKP